MHPVLVQIGLPAGALAQAGPFTIYSYGVMLAVAVLVCAWGFGRDAVKAGVSRDTAYDLLFWTVAGGILGARILYVSLFWDQFAATPLEILMINHGGLAWQGGFIGGAMAGIIWCRRHAQPLRQMLDLSAPYLALGQAIGRTGCFFNGCCYGKPWIHGIFFPVHNARLHPTQLYEFAGLLFIFIILKMSAAKPHNKGMIFVTYLWLAAIERFLVEFFRADHDLLWFGLSLSQYIALGVFIAGLIYYFIIKRNSSR